MSDLTREQINELFERSKGDRAIIVGSEVRQLCGTATRTMDERDALKEAMATLTGITKAARESEVSALAREAALRSALVRLDAIYADEQEPGEYGGPVRPGWLRDALGEP